MGNVISSCFRPSRADPSQQHGPQTQPLQPVPGRRPEASPAIELGSFQSHLEAQGPSAHGGAGTTASVGNANAFNSDPAAFSGSHIINTLTPTPPVGAGATLPQYRPGEVADGATSIVRYNLPNAEGPGNPVRLNVTGSATSVQAGAGQTAYWVPYNPGRTNGVSVPAHPNPTLGQPTTVLTSALTGCSFHATPDPEKPDNIVFSHASQALYGPGNSAIPHGGVGASYAPPQGYGPGNYPAGSPAGLSNTLPDLEGQPQPNNANVGSAFAHYKAGNENAPGSWNIVQQSCIIDPEAQIPTMRPVLPNGNIGQEVSTSTFPVHFPTSDV